mmetsp:Transcript_22285/g.68921  ORF Transcript_22285/g.68921 Transcript_22285/m.68921 type:complete len:207 (+) Transcript_22285:148-768(+)
MTLVRRAVERRSACLASFSLRRRASSCIFSRRSCICRYWYTVVKFEPTTEMGSESTSNPLDMMIMVRILPTADTGPKSPYPSEDIVSSENHITAGIDSNGDTSQTVLQPPLSYVLGQTYSAWRSKRSDDPTSPSASANSAAAAKSCSSSGRSAHGSPSPECLSRSAALALSRAHESGGSYENGVVHSQLTCRTNVCRPLSHMAPSI